MMERNYLMSQFVRTIYKVLEGTESSTFHSKCIPLYAINSNSLIEVGEKLFIFGLPDFERGFYYSSIKFTIQEVKKSIRGDYEGFKMYKNTKGEIIFIGRGSIFDSNGNVLLLLVSENIENSSSPNLEHLSLFLSYDIYDAKYKILYKTVFEQMIDPALKSGVEMRVMSSDAIYKTVFKPVIKDLDRFENIDEFNRYNREELFKEWFKEEVLLKKLKVDFYETKSRLNLEFSYRTGAELPEDTLAEFVQEILEISQLPSNMFRTLPDLIDEFLDSKGFTRDIDTMENE